MTNKEVIKNLVRNNRYKYQLLKAAEETSELTTALLQFVTKDGGKTTKKDVIDEIGDVKIRLEILEEVFGKIAVKKRYNEKLKKFSGYIKNNMYTGKI